MNENLLFAEHHKSIDSFCNKPTVFHRLLLDAISYLPTLITLHSSTMSIASEKELITEPFSFTLRQNSAIEDDSHLSAVLDQTNLKSKFEEPTIIVEGAMKIMGRVKAVTDLKNIVEIPSCLRPEESCYHADTIAKRSVPNDRQTACLQNHLNSGKSTMMSSAVFLDSCEVPPKLF